MKVSTLSVVILAFSIVISGYFIGNTIHKANNNNREVNVKGLAIRHVDADIAIWPMEIKRSGNDLAKLYEGVQEHKDAVKAFFLNMGFDDTEVNVGATNVIDRQMREYSTNYVGSRYILAAELTIRTSNISLIQKAQTDLIDLIGEGILVTSKNEWRPIEYRFTGLNDIKPEMIEESTINAKEAASKFVESSTSRLGSIKSANQGLFSISDLDSNTPDKKVVRVVSSVSFYLKN